MDLPNPNRIDLDDRAQVMLWADLLSIPAERLVEIAHKVGPMSAAIRFYASRMGDDERRPARSVRQRQPELRVRPALAGLQADVAAVGARDRTAYRETEAVAPSV